MKKFVGMLVKVEECLEYIFRKKACITLDHRADFKDLD